MEYMTFTQEQIEKMRKGAAKSFELICDKWRDNIKKAIINRITKMRDKLRDASLNDDWIPVDKELPNNIRTVLVSDGNTVELGYFDFEYGKWRVYSLDTKFMDVKAWKDLPKPCSLGSD